MIVIIRTSSARLLAAFDLGYYARIAAQLAKAREIKATIIGQVLDSIALLLGALAAPPLINAGDPTIGVITPTGPSC